MKKLFICFLSLCVITSSFAQDSSFKKAPAIGGSIFIKDFPTAAVLKNLNTTGWNGYLAPGIEGFYIQGLNSYLDLIGSLGFSWSKYKKSNSYFYYEDAPYKGQAKILMDVSALVHYKFITDKNNVVPYLAGGLALSLYNGSYVLPSVPLGGGLQFKLENGAFIYVQTLMQFGVLTNVTYNSAQNATKENLNYSVGFSMPLKKSVKAPAKVVVVKPVVIDTDGDGIPDNIDKCPTVVGFAKYTGCPIPDSDGDGINDEQDSCPHVAGLARYHGCPIPDTDGDGINDEQDSCPKVPGLAKYHGCPIPDSDGDGINDEEDKCPHEVGTVENHGCPEIQSKINELAKSIYFNPGSAVIANKAYPVLNQVLDLMIKYTGFNLEIEGHTDNLGSPIANQKISQRRADAIKNYFIAKGINESRLYAIGYGLEKPIASNKTASGRALNRRVELHAKY